MIIQYHSILDRRGTLLTAKPTKVKNSNNVQMRLLDTPCTWSQSWIPRAVGLENVKTGRSKSHMICVLLPQL